MQAGMQLEALLLGLLQATFLQPAGCCLFTALSDATGVCRHHGGCGRSGVQPEGQVPGAAV